MSIPGWDGHPHVTPGIFTVSLRRSAEFKTRVVMVSEQAGASIAGIAWAAWAVFLLSGRSGVIYPNLQGMPLV
jgi:hypothetical protein